MGVACRGWADAPAIDADERRTIERTLLESGDPLAAVVRDPGARVSRVPSAPLRATVVDRVERDNPSGPTVFYWGWNRGQGKGFRTTGQPSQWSALVAADGVQVQGASDAIALARLWFQTTQPTGERHLLVESVDALPFRPRLDEKASRVRDEARRSLAGTLRPLSARAEPPPADAGWVVTGHAIDGMKLVELELHVARGGQVRPVSRIVRDDLPLVYAGSGD